MSSNYKILVESNEPIEVVKAQLEEFVERTGADDAAVAELDRLRDLGFLGR